MNYEITQELAKSGHQLAVLLGTQHGMLDASSLVQRMAGQLEVLAAVLREKTKRSEELAAENAVRSEFIAHCFRVAADGGTLDGGDIQELGERLGLFGRETYQPVLHGYICGHEAGEDTVYVMKKKPATDAFLREVRAQGVEEFVKRLRDSADIYDKNGRHEWADNNRVVADDGNFFAAELRKGGAA